LKPRPGDCLTEALARCDNLSALAASNIDLAQAGTRDRHSAAYDIIVLSDALTRIPDEVKGLEPDVPWRAIRAMRNILVHEWWRVDWTMVGRVIRQDVPTLTAALQRLSASLQKPSS
jgi:uncharacterized protein with HEPN domain